MKNLKLLNGQLIPEIGYGTWLIEDSKAPECVKMAIEAGYNHIDTAQVYENEVGVGKGIKLANVKREDIYVTSKVSASIKNYKEAKESIDESLRKLDMDYIDLMLIHCPWPWEEYGQDYRYFKENSEVYKALEEAYEEGKLKAIGVSNFDIQDIENLIKNNHIVPMVNQIPIHIGYTNLKLIQYCMDKGIIVEAYSPIDHGAALKDERLKEIANRYNVSIPQLCIKYTLQLGTVSLPKASSKEHIEENISLNFEISNEDMEMLKRMTHDN